METLKKKKKKVGLLFWTDKAKTLGDPVINQQKTFLISM